MLARLMEQREYRFGAIYMDHALAQNPLDAEPHSALLLLEVSGLTESEQHDRLNLLQGQMSEPPNDSMSGAVTMLMPSNYLASPVHVYSNRPIQYLVQLEFPTDARAHEVLWTIGSGDIQEEPGWCFETLCASHSLANAPASSTICVEAFDDSADCERSVRKFTSILAEDEIPLAPQSAVTLHGFSLWSSIDSQSNIDTATGIDQATAMYQQLSLR